MVANGWGDDWYWNAWFKNTKINKKLKNRIMYVHICTHMYLCAMTVNEKRGHGVEERKEEHIVWRKKSGGKDTVIIF